MFSPRTFVVLLVFTLGSLSHAQFNDADTDFDQIALLARGDDAADFDFASAFYGRDADPEPEPEPELESKPIWDSEWQHPQARGELDSICASPRSHHL